MAGFQKDQGRAQKTVDNATAAARKKRDEVTRTRNDSTRRTALSTAERKEKEATTARSKVAELSRKIADDNKSIATKRASLRRVEQSEQRDRVRAEDRRRRKSRASSALGIVRMSDANKRRRTTPERLPA